MCMGIIDFFENNTLNEQVDVTNLMTHNNIDSHASF